MKWIGPQGRAGLISGKGQGTGLGRPQGHRERGQQGRGVMVKSYQLRGQASLLRPMFRVWFMGVLVIMFL